MDPRELAYEVRSQLRTLSKLNAEKVARHLVAAGRLVDEDPAAALQHARAARALGARVAVVREAVGETAYAAGEWTEAIAELRTARRMTGDDSALPMIADAERALGRADRALKIAQSDEAQALDPAGRAEMRIVEAGARHDLGQLDAALLTLQDFGLDRTSTQPWSARVWYAYADLLLAAGREDEAREWFVAAAGADQDGTTDAEERVLQLDGIEVLTDEDDEPADDEAADATDAVDATTAVDDGDADDGDADDDAIGSADAGAGTTEPDEDDLDTADATVETTRTDEPASEDDDEVEPPIAEVVDADEAADEDDEASADSVDLASTAAEAGELVSDDDEDDDDPAGSVDAGTTADVNELGSEDDQDGGSDDKDLTGSVHAGTTADVDGLGSEADGEDLSDPVGAGGATADADEAGPEDDDPAGSTTGSGEDGEPGSIEEAGGVGGDTTDDDETELEEAEDTGTPGNGTSSAPEVPSGPIVLTFSDQSKSGSSE